MISDNQIRDEMQLCKDYGMIPKDMTFKEYLNQYYGIGE